MWLSENIRYGAELGYVMLQLPPVKLPAFQLEGIDFEPKEELHCSLFCTKKLAESFSDPVQAEIALVDFTKQYLQKNSLAFTGFTRHAYICEDGDVKSIVIGATLNGIDELFAALRRTFKELAGLEPPALHVTLYKYNHQFGIGIQNDTQLRALCRPIPVEILPTTVKEML